MSARSVRRALLLAAAAAAAAACVCIGEACWIHLKAEFAQVLIADAWRRAQHGAGDARPWPWADTAPVARLIISGPEPAELFVLEGTSGASLAFGPAHDAASVLPGERGNSVIAGHRDTSFRVLRRVRVGDRLWAERRDGGAWFAVRDVRVVDSRTTRIALESPVPRLTLVTCYPFDAVVPGGPQRWVVTADEIAAWQSRAGAATAASRLGAVRTR